MIWLKSLLSRLAGTDWRDIATAPFDRSIELAVIDGKIGVLPNFCLCHGNDWFDAENAAAGQGDRNPLTLCACCGFPHKLLLRRSAGRQTN